MMIILIWLGVGALCVGLILVLRQQKVSTFNLSDKATRLLIVFSGVETTVESVPSAQATSIPEKPKETSVPKRNFSVELRKRLTRKRDVHLARPDVAVHGDLEEALPSEEVKEPLVSRPNQKQKLASLWQAIVRRMRRRSTPVPTDEPLLDETHETKPALPLESLAPSNQPAISEPSSGEETSRGDETDLDAFIDSLPDHLITSIPSSEDIPELIPTISEVPIEDVPKRTPDVLESLPEGSGVQTEETEEIEEIPDTPLPETVVDIVPLASESPDESTEVQATDEGGVGEATSAPALDVAHATEERALREESEAPQISEVVPEEIPTYQEPKAPALMSSEVPMYTQDDEDLVDFSGVPRLSDTQREQLLKEIADTPVEIAREEQREEELRQAETTEKIYTWLDFVGNQTMTEEERKKVIAMLRELGEPWCLDVLANAFNEENAHGLRPLILEALIHDFHGEVLRQVYEYVLEDSAAGEEERTLAQNALDELPPA